MKKSVAIDGPSGAGKSTIARKVAQSLGYVYVDTGALYRVIGLYVMRQGADPADAEAVERLLPQCRVEYSQDGITLNGEDVSTVIREHTVSQYASDVSAHEAVRAFLLDCQRQFAREGNVVMDGRDIGTVVLPDATVKIYLTASSEERARRRYEELRARGQNVDYASILADVKHRDDNDMNRAAAPLRPAEDAVVVDTTGNTWEQSARQLEELIRSRLS